MLNIENIKSKNGMPNLKVSSGLGQRYLYSLYNPEGECQLLLEGIKGDTVIFFGIGLGYHIDMLLKSKNVMNIIVVEPFEEILSVFKKTKLYSNIATNIDIYCGMDFEQITKKICSKYDAADIISSDIVALNFYKTIDGSFTKFTDCLGKRLRAIRIDTNTRGSFSRQWSINYFENLKITYDRPNIDSYCNAFKGIPAVIVSSGPSLDKNISLLEEVSGKALIISPNNSTWILESYNIKPDMMMCLDGGEITKKIYEKVKDRNSFMLISDNIYYGTPKLFNRDNLIICDMTSEIKKGMIKRKLKISSTAFPNGPSVSNLALVIADYLGCSPIIMIGQDLAYTNSAMYSNSSWKVDLSNSRYLMYKDIYGNDIYTDSVFLSMRDWFEEYLAYRGNLHVINATEAGLNIEGMTNMKLREAIDLYIANRPSVDFNSIIRVNYRVNRGISIKDYKTLFEVYIKEIGQIISICNKRKNTIIELIELNNSGRGESHEYHIKGNYEESLWSGITSFEVFKTIINEAVYPMFQTIKIDVKLRMKETKDETEKRKILLDGTLKQVAFFQEECEFLRSVLNEFVQNT